MTEWLWPALFVLTLPYAVWTLRQWHAALTGPHGPRRFRLAEAALGLVREGRSSVGTHRGRRVTLALPPDTSYDPVMPDDHLPRVLTWPVRTLRRARRGPRSDRLEALGELAGPLIFPALGVAMLADGDPWGLWLFAFALLPHTDSLALPTLAVPAAVPFQLGGPPQLSWKPAPTGDAAVDAARPRGPPARVLAMLDPATRALLVAHVTARGVISGEDATQTLRPGDDPVEVADRLVALAEQLEAAAARPVVPALIERVTTDPLPAVRARALDALHGLGDDEARDATAALLAALVAGRRPADALGDAASEVRLAAALRLAEEARPADLEALLAARRRADVVLAPWLDRAIATARERVPADGGGRLTLTERPVEGRVSAAPREGGRIALRRDEGA